MAQSNPIVAESSVGPSGLGRHEQREGKAASAYAKSLGHVRLFAIPWTVAHHAPLSMEFSKQEYWSGFLFPSPGGPVKESKKNLLKFKKSSQF